VTSPRNERFRALHARGTFVIPNPHDPGTACIYAALGAVALATTSSGFANSLGRLDGATTLDELVAHTAAITSATDVPLNVDAERCFAEDLDGVAATVVALADAGAAGCSIEDWNPAAGAIDPIDEAVARVAAAARAAASRGMVLTARAENHLRGVDDIDDTIRRLCAYRDAGAEVVYAPALVKLDVIARVVTETAVPVNVLLIPGGPTVAELADVGVRRVSTGGTLARIAYGAAAAALRELLDTGALTQSIGMALDRGVAASAFAADR
jgi:2-methylisocitrate lyase-like PEP mutase family enzyme